MCIFNGLNRNRLSVSLDLTKEEGKRLFKELVKVSDIVIDNYSAGVMDRLGIGYEALKEVKPDIIVACGPMEMLACIIGITEKYDLPCQVSIETLMACGMGACLGCAVEGRDQPDRYLHACLDGPVFDASELNW